MCESNRPHQHHHGAFDSGTFGRFKPVGRRTFLAGVGKGTFALLTEVSVARNVIAIAIGSTAMAACAAPPPAAPTLPATPAPSNTESPTVPVAPTEAATATTAPTTAPAVEATPAATAVATTSSTSIALPPATYNQVNLGFVNAYVLVRGNEVAVVDTGVAGSAGRIEEVIKAAGRAWGDVRYVILTHYHQDHIGSMDAVMAASTNATAYAGPLDIPQIKISAPLQSVSDGQEIFGLQVVYTPGHTPGHISIYDPAGSALITGDALSNSGGVLGGPNARFTADMATANESVKRLAQLTFERAYFMHGDTIEAGASKAIADLAATLK
jgi:glyoxylase-like metal-dependent hydrolase (beta-lactamase superfamily II)